MNNEILKKIKSMTISHDEFMNLHLQNPDFQREWLSLSILEYAKDGDYTEFYRALEQVIKARGTVSEFAEAVGINRSNLIDLLHGRTKTAPNLTTISKILDGLGFTLSVSEKKPA